VREYGVLRIVTAETEPGGEAETPLEPGRDIEWNGWRIFFGTADESAADGDNEALVPENILKSLVVRRREDGDRIGAGRRKLQDLFTDATVPAAVRTAWAVMRTGTGRYWVQLL